MTEFQQDSHRRRTRPPHAKPWWWVAPLVSCVLMVFLSPEVLGVLGLDSMAITLCSGRSGSCAAQTGVFAAGILELGALVLTALQWPMAYRLPLAAGVVTACWPPAFVLLGVLLLP